MQIIKKINKKPKNEIMRNHKVKHSKMNLHDSYHISGVSAFKYSSWFNTTELSKKYDNSYSSR